VWRVWPRLREAARLLQAAHPGLEVVVAGVRGCSYPETDHVRLYWHAPATVLAAADAALCKCGSASLEAALAGVPHVIGYALHPASYAVARRVVRVPFVGLVNLLAGRRVVPELIQHEARPDRIAAAVLPLLDPEGSAARAQRAAFAEVRTRLGPPGAARRAATMALELVA
jgi:lipid-A-disaccharide synthase